mmetsp:Transcript_39537/g.35325  ORF Transcript_39537/g.35325 Transcript_39537/m.35325 type:complete len:94 (-) Transcript_39537:178-459(-)
MTQYGKPEYWDERYSRDLEPFDWYQRFNGIRDAFEKFITTDSKILNVGAGNSRFSEEMYEDDYKNVVNIDISSIVVKQMQEKYQDFDDTFKYM